MTLSGGEIRARRESLGLTVEAVAEATRIPAAHLRALEDGRDDELPPGPYADAYRRTLVSHLGLEPSADDPVAPEAPAPTGVPLWAVRGLAGVSLLAVLSAGAYQVWAQRTAAGEAVDTPGAPDQIVAISARRTTSLTVRVDGQTVFDDELPGGDALTFDGHDRVEVDLRAASAVSLTYNGERIVPQGRQDAPRTLVFVDDLAGAP